MTAGPKSTERLAELEDAGEFSEQLFVHGLAVQAAEGMAEWLHSQVRRGLEIEWIRAGATRGAIRRAPSSQSTRRSGSLLELEGIGMTLSGGYAVMPEQSTVAIVAHHPQAVYFGMKSGFVPKEKSPDELIAGTKRGGELPPADEPRDGAVEEEAIADRAAAERTASMPG